MQFQYYKKGYLKVRLTSKAPERFLNMCAHHQIEIWDLKCMDSYYEMNLHISDFYRLKPLLRKTGSRVKITGKYGMPFFFYRNKKRKAFFLGFVCSVILLLLLSEHIWNIHVEGNLHNSTEAILGYLEEINIYHGIAKDQIDCASVQDALRARFPDITWVSAKISGSRLLLEIKENNTARFVQPSGEEICDLKAEKPGKIVSIITRKGIPLKKAGDTFTKDEILVSGRVEILNDSKELVKYVYTKADADIYAAYTYYYYQEFPRQYEKRVYTGEKKKGYVIRAGDYMLDFYSKPNFEEYEAVTDLKQVSITESFKIPLFYGINTAYSCQTKQEIYTKKEAYERAEKKLKNVLSSLEEKGLEISSNHVKIDVQNSQCVAKGTITVIEKTGVPSPVEILEVPTERNQNINE